MTTGKNSANLSPRYAHAQAANRGRRRWNLRTLRLYSFRLSKKWCYRLLSDFPNVLPFTEISLFLSSRLLIWGIYLQMMIRLKPRKHWLKHGILQNYV